jgi:hypothetical protein
MMAPDRPTEAQPRADVAAGFGGPPPQRPSMQLLNWKPLIRNSLRGFADVELPSGLRIREIPVLSSHGKSWATLPSKPQIDKDGRHRKGPDGKPAYTAILEWRTTDLKDGFSAKVVELVRAAHPDAFADKGAL